MNQKYTNDLIGGREVPPLVINDDYVLIGTHQGSVHVEKGIFTLEGTLQGSLDIQQKVTASIKGNQQGSINIRSNAKVTVDGAIQGSTTIDHNALLVIEAGGRLAGSLSNYGKIIIRGVFGGSRSGDGELIIEGDGYIKKPIIRNGANYYEW